MSPERKLIHEYYPHAISTEGSIIDRAVKGQLEITPTLLPQAANEDLGIEIYDFDDSRRYVRNRNVEGLNVDFMMTSLDVKTNQLGEPLAAPVAINQQTRAVFRTENNSSFAGYSEHEFTYWRTGFDDRLEQKVGIINMLKSISPVVESVLVRRFVLDNVGDVAYGSVFLQTREIVDKLGVGSSNGDPVFLTFTPEQVLVTTYGSEVLGKISYEELAKVGIKAHFTDEPTQALLDLQVNNLSFKLRLGKVLKPNYPSLLFSPSEEWITASGIIVGKTPQEVLN